jgi:prolyl 4-hydroxylase
MRGCAALALLAAAQALSTTTLKPPTITATEKQVIACVDRVQRALDAAENAPRASASIDPIDVADLATAKGREQLAEDLRKRHHAILRVNDEGACQALQDAALSLVDDEARLQYIGGATPVSQDRQTEFVGVFAGTTNRFVEVRYGRGNEALPATIQRELPELNQARRCLGSLGRLLCVATLDTRANLADDVACDSGGNRGEASTTAHRLCAYAPTNQTAFGAHTDTSFFTLVPFSSVPGLEVLDPSLQRWLCPEAEVSSKGEGHLVLAMPGEFLEVASHGSFQASVHRVRGGSEKRVSTPLLVRADLREPWDGLEASSVWRALQKNTGSEARVELAPSIDSRKRYVAPVRTLAEAQAFYGMLCAGSEVLSLSPLVVKMPGFASHDECDALLKLSDDAKRSTIDNEQVTTSHRTSRTKWLDDDEVPARLSERAAMVSELPMSNAERWQLAQYGENCEYKLHVDTVPEFNDLAPGGRFSTLLLYLDEPEEGGSTDFPDLGLRIKPETGTALYFRNVREPVSDPFSLETHAASCHAGAPVLKGAKHIATRWVHPVPYPDGLS